MSKPIVLIVCMGSSSVPQHQVWTNHTSNGYHQGMSVLMAARRDWDGLFVELQCTKTMNLVGKVRTGRTAAIDRRNRWSRTRRAGRQCPPVSSQSLEAAYHRCR